MAFLSERERLALTLGDWPSQRDRIRRDLTRYGITQARLALEVETDQGHLSRWLSGAREPSLDSRLNLDDAMHRLIYGSTDGR